IARVAAPTPARMAPAGRLPVANSTAPVPSVPKIKAFFQFSIAPPDDSDLEEREGRSVVSPAFNPDLFARNRADIVPCSAGFSGNPEALLQAYLKGEAWRARVNPRRWSARSSAAFAAAAKRRWRSSMTGTRPYSIRWRYGCSATPAGLRT